MAQALHIRSCRDLDTEQLRDILVQEDDFLGQGLLRVKEAYNSSVCIFSPQQLTTTVNSQYLLQSLIH